MIRSYQSLHPRVAPGCYIDISAQVIGDVTLGERSSVWMNAVLRGDVNSIRVGANSNVQDCAVLHGQRNLYPVVVGDWVTIGHNATVHGCVVEDGVLSASACAFSTIAESARARCWRRARSFRKGLWCLRGHFGPECPQSCGGS
jgi:carbonic anhydrase/acetyltransferase-like protein (isoleucine patch superfamily)